MSSQTQNFEIFKKYILFICCEIPMRLGREQTCCWMNLRVLASPRTMNQQISFRLMKYLSDNDKLSYNWPTISEKSEHKLWNWSFTILLPNSYHCVIIARLLYFLLKFVSMAKVNGKRHAVHIFCCTYFS